MVRVRAGQYVVWEVASQLKFDDHLTMVLTMTPYLMRTVGIFTTDHAAKPYEVEFV